MIFFQFIISAAVILVAGIFLTRYADKLSDILGVGKLWIGVVLLGLVTSLPEAGASLVAAVNLKAYDLSVGNMAGSNAFNLLLIVLLDMAYRKGPVTNVIPYGKAQKISAGFAFGFAALAAFDIFLSSNGGLPTVLGMSPASALIMVFYFIGMYCVYRNNPAQKDQADIRVSGESIFKICFVLALSAVAVVVGAIVLANAADRIAIETGLGRTFVGSLFLALATSLPEMVVTVSALSLGQFDLAVGNIFGSNMTNMFLIAVCDMVIGKSAILGLVSVTHVVMLILSCIMTVVVLKGLSYKQKESFGGLGGDSWLLMMIYAIGMAVLYILK